MGKNLDKYYFADIHSKEQLSAFLAESLIMKDFHHPHILGLLGVCFDAPDGSPYIVLPFMANGSVKNYLKEKRAHVLDVNSIPMVYTYNLTCTLHKITRMWYLKVLSGWPLL